MDQTKQAPKPEMAQLLQLVDLQDKVTGSAAKDVVHREGLLHRAFSVFLVNGRGELLLQKRSRSKYHSGGLWTNACCSHPRCGEELSFSARRRLLEELGVDLVPDEIGHFVYRSVYANGVTEYEYDHIFLGTFEGVCTPDPEEIEELSWWTVQDLERAVIEEPERFTTWFITALPLVLDTLSKKEDER